MARQSLKFRKPYFVTPTTEIDIEDKGKQIRVAKLCKPLFVLLPLIGFFINTETNSKWKFVQRVYILSMFLRGIWHMGTQLYPMFRQEFNEDSIWYLSYTDHYVVIAVSYTAAFKTNQICHFVKHSWHLFRKYGVENAAVGRLKKRAASLFILSVLYPLTTCGITIWGILEENSFVSEIQRFSKSSQLTTLFTAQLTTAPVTINASKLFAIDYNLITVVISIAITYLTVMSTVASTKETASLQNFYNYTSKLNSSLEMPLY
ncbi:hypothetical protein CHUAL_009913 [Chamberlinius hualienensis]